MLSKLYRFCIFNLHSLCLSLTLSLSFDFRPRHSTPLRSPDAVTTYPAHVRFTTTKFSLSLFTFTYYTCRQLFVSCRLSAPCSLLRCSHYTCFFRVFPVFSLVATFLRAISLSDQILPVTVPLFLPLPLRPSELSSSVVHSRRFTRACVWLRVILIFFVSAFIFSFFCFTFTLISCRLHIRFARCIEQSRVWHSLTVCVQHAPTATMYDRV